MKTFNELLIKKGINVNKLHKQSGVALMTLYDLKNEKVEFKNCKVETALKIANALRTDIEFIYSYLYEEEKEIDINKIRERLTKADKERIRRQLDFARKRSSIKRESEE